MTLPQLIQTVGYVGMFFIIFFETGFPFGFIFPGDSLLFTAGLLSATGLLYLPFVILAVTLGAILGDSVGYWLGWRIGRPLLSRKYSFFSGERLIAQTEAFYLKYGVRSLIIARFVPGVRTFVPIFAGLGHMPYKQFITYNIIGGLAWGVLMPLAGFWLGHTIPQSEHYLSYIIIAILVISTLPVLFEVYKAKRKHKN